MAESKGRRRYTQTRRAESAADTRRRLIEATRACLTAEVLGSVSLEEIARRAGVSRSTLHLVFGSRAQLMLAVAEDALARGGFADLADALEATDAREAFRGAMAAAGRLYAGDYPVFKALLSLGGTDGDAAAAAERLNRGRMEGMQDIARRLIREGYVSHLVSEAEATDILWVVTSFETFDQLYEGRGLSAEDATQRLLEMAERALNPAR